MVNTLIVDDSRASRKILRDMLEAIGQNVIGEAVNGEDGFLKFIELKPELVLMDVTMPKMNGLEALQLIIKADETAKVIMLTAAGQQDNRKKARKIGAKAYVIKPIDQDILEETIRKVLALQTQNSDAVITE